MKQSIDLDHFPRDETAKDMLSMVTRGWYDNSYVGKWLFEVMGLSMSDAKRLFEELKMQAFPQTATWGLCYHEQKYQISPRGDLENRRKAVLDRKFNRLPFNPEVLKMRIENYTGFSKEHIDILENLVAPNSHKVVFYENDESCLKSTDGLIAYVNGIKQSHAHFDWNRSYSISVNHGISTEAAIDISIDFYPRYNLAPLLFDGTWMIDGSYFLTGYKSDERFDFNPLSLYIEIDHLVKQRHESSFYVSIDTEIQSQQEASTKINMEVNHNVNHDSGTHAYIDTYVSCSSDAEVTIKENYWMLDGSVILDGSRFLNADEINLTL